MDAYEEIVPAAEDFRRAVTHGEPYRPLFVKIKLGFACNLRCRMCNHWREVREPPLPMDRFRELLGELAALGCQKVHLTGGEPLLRPEVPELVAAAHELGLRVTMTTNGTLVDKALAKALIQAGLRGVNVSLDSPDRHVHDRMRGVRGAWKGAVQAVQHFARHAHRGKLTLRVNTTITRLNYAGLIPLPDLVKELGATRLNLIGVDDHCNDRLALHRRELESYNRSIAPALGERAVALGLMDSMHEAYPFGKTSQEALAARTGLYAFGWYDRHPCFVPWYHSLVDFNGLVYPCCMTREQVLPLGDLRESTFAGIWHGKSYAALRSPAFLPILPQCRRCDDFTAVNRGLLGLLAGCREADAGVAAPIQTPSAAAEGGLCR